MPTSRPPSPLLAVVLTIATLVPPVIAAAPSGKGKENQPLPRLKEMLDWIAVEQQSDGGWAHRLWLPLRYHAHSASKPKRESQYPAGSFDTAMCGLALIRAGNTLDRGDYAREVRAAAEYLYRAVQSSSERTV